ncbi:hypothetical protein [Fundidesulfovibrio soli]|uniref:hypothetical protein n=1 Tax=Fundidesulfovibrio soli TaxID=2922716 RepID=UPI001FAF3A96|nr:hypothetical protein [Fundidesulfovibrio soli]
MSDDINDYQPNVNTFQMDPPPASNQGGVQQPAQPEPQPALTMEEALDRMPKTITWIDLAKKFMPRVDPQSVEGSPESGGLDGGKGIGGLNTGDEPSYNAFDYLPKPTFPTYRTGEGTYGRPIQFEGQPIESSQPYNIIRSEEKDGTYYHFVDQLPTRKLTPGETDVVAGVAGLPVGAASTALSWMAGGQRLGAEVHPAGSEIGALGGAVAGALWGGANGYENTRKYLDESYHHPIPQQGPHVFIENEPHDYP